MVKVEYGTMIIAQPGYYHICYKDYESGIEKKKLNKRVLKLQNNAFDCGRKDQECLIVCSIVMLDSKKQLF